MIGTCAAWSVLGGEPPSDVAPHPTMSSRVPGAHREVSAEPETLVGGFVELVESFSSVMS